MQIIHILFLWFAASCCVRAQDTHVYESMGEIPSSAWHVLCKAVVDDVYVMSQITASAKSKGSLDFLSEFETSDKDAKTLVNLVVAGAKSALTRCRIWSRKCAILDAAYLEVAFGTNSQVVYAVHPNGYEWSILRNTALGLSSFYEPIHPATIFYEVGGKTLNIYQLLRDSERTVKGKNLSVDPKTLPYAIIRPDATNFITFRYFMPRSDSYWAVSIGHSGAVTGIKSETNHPVGRPPVDLDFPLVPPRANLQH